MSVNQSLLVPFVTLLLILLHLLQSGPVIVSARYDYLRTVITNKDCPIVISLLPLSANQALISCLQYQSANTTVYRVSEASIATPPQFIAAFADCRAILQQDEATGLIFYQCGHVFGMLSLSPDQPPMILASLPGEYRCTTLVLWNPLGVLSNITVQAGCVIGNSNNLFTMYGFNRTSLDSQTNQTITLPPIILYKPILTDKLAGGFTAVSAGSKDIGSLWIVSYDKYLTFNPGSISSQNNNQTRVNVPTTFQCGKMANIAYNTAQDLLYISCESAGVIRMRNAATSIAANLSANLNQLEFEWALTPAQCGEAATNWIDQRTGYFYAVCWGSGVMRVADDVTPNIMTLISTTQCSSPAASGAFIRTITTNRLGTTVYISCSTGVISGIDGFFSEDMSGSVCAYPSDIVIDPSNGDLIQGCFYGNHPIARIRGEKVTTDLGLPDSICSSALGLQLDVIHHAFIVGCDGYGVVRLMPDRTYSTLLSYSTCKAVQLFASAISNSTVYVICSKLGVYEIDLITLGTTLVYRGVNTVTGLAQIHNHTLYIAIAKYGVFAVNTNTGTNTTALTLQQCPNPHAIVADVGTSTLFVSCDDSLMQYTPSSSSSSSSSSSDSSSSQQQSQLVLVTNSARGCPAPVSVQVFDNKVWFLCDFSNVYYLPLNQYSDYSSDSLTLFPNECVDPSALIIDTQASIIYTSCSGFSGSSSGYNYQCYAGSEWSYGLCIDCSIGYYRNYTHILNHIVTCQPCEKGSVATITGADACSICEPGKYQVSPYIECQLCPIGSYSSAYGSISCEYCSSGHYGNTTGLSSSSCTGVCDAGYWCGDGSTRPKQLPCGSRSVYCPTASSRPQPVTAGYYSSTPAAQNTDNTMTEQQPCDIGSYCDGSGFARPCSPGRYQNQTATSICIECEIGRFSDGLLRNSTGAVVIDPMTGQSIQGATICQLCNAGSFSDHHGSIVCSLCSPGTSQSVSGSTVCEDCEAGRSAAEAGYSSCQICSVGRFSSNVRSISCTSCSPGRYQSQSGNTTCVDCRAGQYSFDFNAVRCELCSAGRYSEKPAAVSCAACSQGSASNVTGLDTVCPPCVPGTSQLSTAQTSCDPCPPKKYSTNYGTLECVSCTTVTNAERTTCNQTSCDANTEYDADDGICTTCSIGKTSSRGGSCTICPSNTYTPYIGSNCISCIRSGMDGLSCIGGRISVKEGYWAYEKMMLVDDGITSSYIIIYQSQRCPDAFCQGALLQQEYFQNTTAVAMGLQMPITYSSQCVYPRLDSSDNVLCGACVDGFIPQGDSCVECKQGNGGLLFLYLLISIALVIFLYRSASSESSAGHSVVLMYFAQTAMLEVGPVKGFLQWVRIVNFNATSATGSTCLAPMTAYQQYMVSIAMPLLLLAELTIIALIHRLIQSCVKSTSISAAVSPRPSIASDASSSSRSSFSHLILSALNDFQWSRYIGGGVSILLFCYTQATTSCIKYLYCIDAGDQSVVFTDPTIDCRSSEYKRYLIPIIFALVIYVILFPIIAFAFLLSRHQYFHHRANTTHTIHTTTTTLTHRHLNTDDESRSTSSSVVSVGSGSDSSIMSSGFLMRYGILFQAFSSHAWYYQVVVLIRRAVFVIVSVVLTESSDSRAFSFVLLNIASMILHLYVKPFVDESVNQSETISILMLLIISALINAYSPPYTIPTQVVLFLLIVPTIGFLLIQIIRQKAAIIHNRIKRSMSKGGSSGVNGSSVIELNDESKRTVAVVPSHHTIRSPLRSDTRCVSNNAVARHQASQHTSILHDDQPTTTASSSSVVNETNEIELVEIISPVSAVVQSPISTVSVSTSNSTSSPQADIVASHDESPQLVTAANRLRQMAAHLLLPTTTTTTTSASSSFTTTATAAVATAAAVDADNENLLSDTAMSSDTDQYQL